MADEHDLDAWFTLSPEPHEHRERVRKAAADFARVVLRATRPNADQEVALQRIREATYYAESAL